MKNQSAALYPEERYSLTPFNVKPEKLFRVLLDVVCAVDEKGTLWYISPSSFSLFGYMPAEITGYSLLHFIHPEDADKTARLFSEKTKASGFKNFESRVVKKEGEAVPMLWSGRWDEEDRLFYCVGRDGSVKYEVEQRLLKSQQMARVANYEFDVLSQSYTYASDTIFDIFGLDKKQHPSFTSQLFWSLVHPDDVEKVKKDVLYITEASNSMLEFRMVTPAGETVYIRRHREIVVDASGRVVKTIGTLQDISSSCLSENAVRQSEERLRFLVQNGSDMIGILDQQGNYVFVGAGIKEQMGYEAEELVGRNALDFIHPDDAAWVRTILQSMENKGTISVSPFRFKNRAGEWRWVECSVTNHLANPAVSGLVINSRDVTEKKYKDDVLLLSQQRFEALTKNGSDLVVIIDQGANFTYLSSNLPAVLGYAPDELLGKNVMDFVHADDWKKVEAKIANVVTVDEMPNSIHHRFLHKSGNWVWLESKGVNHTENSAIGGILVNSRNVDDRVKLQQRLNRELINKQKEITSAVIKAQETERSQLGLELHDNVNQILTTVKLYNEMYLTGFVQDKELLVKSTQYTQDCINEIRSISKRLSAPTLGKISLQDSIEELVGSINLTKRVKILYLPQNINQCCVSEDLHLAIYRIVQEGLNNIIKYSEASLACISISKRETDISLKISDDGKGFDINTRRAGIGLTNMKTRAENMNGSFAICSAPGKGCEIKIVFPFEEEVKS